jgi:hypothetical protein
LPLHKQCEAIEQISGEGDTVASLEGFFSLLTDRSGLRSTPMHMPNAARATILFRPLQIVPSSCFRNQKALIAPPFPIGLALDFAAPQEFYFTDTLPDHPIDLRRRWKRSFNSVEQQHFTSLEYM